MTADPFLTVLGLFRALEAACEAEGGLPRSHRGRPV